MIMNTEEIKSKLLALKETLKSVEIKKTGGINVFDAAGMTTQEIKHSAFFAWLADAEKPHGLKDAFLRKFCERLLEYKTHIAGAKQNKEIIGEKFSRIETLLNNDYDVVTEKVVVNKESRIDVFITSATAQTAIVIENKVFTTAHDDQLQRYENELALHREYKNYNKIYVYLTPYGELPCNNDGDYDDDWCVFDYKGVRDIVKELHKDFTNAKKDARLKMLLEDYTELIDTNILKENKELRNLCKQIVREHKDALDILFSYTDNAQDVIKYCKDRLENNYDGIRIYKSTNLGFKFCTKAMESFMLKNGESLLSQNGVYRIGGGVGQEDGPVAGAFGINKSREEAWSDAMNKIMIAVDPHKKQGDMYFTVERMQLLSEEDRMQPFDEIQPALERKLKDFADKLHKFDNLLLSM